MTPGDDGAGRPSGLSRRQLLAGIGGVGAVGMASGLGTGAYLADRETFSKNTFGSGTVELLVNGATTDGTVNVDVSGIDRGDSDRERFEIGAQTNPVRVWLATECVPSDALSRALEVDLRAGNASLTGGYRPLADVRGDLLTGERIDDGCLDPDDTIPVDVDWRLPADSPDSVADESTSLTFLLYAEQCRHVDEPNAVGPASLDEASAAASNPFAGRVCDETDDCPDCVEFGKADDIESTLAVGDVIPLSELPAGVDAHEIEITGVETKDDGEAVGAAFVLRPTDGTPGPAICAVEIKGGKETARYQIDPSPETDEILFAPLKANNGKRYGISNILVSVCVRDDDTLDDPETDPECVVCDEGTDTSLATLDVRYLGADDATVSVVSTKGGTSGELFAGTVSRGDVFTLDGKDVDRPGKGTDRLGPEVEISVEGEQRPVAVHVSCSQLLAVGDVYGDFEIAGGTTTGGEPLCGSEAN